MRNAGGRLLGAKSAPMIKTRFMRTLRRCAEHALWAAAGTGAIASLSLRPNRTRAAPHPTPTVARRGERYDLSASDLTRSQGPAVRLTDRGIRHLVPAASVLAGPACRTPRQL